MSEAAFQPLSTPIARPLRDLAGQHLTTLFAAGIVNPFGPTLTVFALGAADGKTTERAIVRVVLNPFSQQAETIGFASSSNFSPFDSGFRESCVESFGGTPTLLLPLSALDTDDNITLYASVLENVQDAVHVLKQLRSFPADPWNRIQEDVDNAVDVPSRQRTTIPQITPHEARELAGALLRPAALSAEFKAFMVAWSGAIEFQSASALAPLAKPLTELAEVFAAVIAGCDLPTLG